MVKSMVRRMTQNVANSTNTAKNKMKSIKATNTMKNRRGAAKRGKTSLLSQIELVKPAYKKSVEEKSGLNAIGQKKLLRFLSIKATSANKLLAKLKAGAPACDAGSSGCKMTSAGANAGRVPVNAE